MPLCHFHTGCPMGHLAAVGGVLQWRYFHVDKSTEHRSKSAHSPCQNAAGELAIKQRPEELGPFAAPVAERLVPILAAAPGMMPRSLVENAAITLGRIAWVCPAQVRVPPLRPGTAEFLSLTSGCAVTDCSPPCSSVDLVAESSLPICSCQSWSSTWCSYGASTQ